MPELKVSINTIKENLIYYLEKILDKEVDGAFIYNYMPYIIINSPRKNFNDINYNNYPLVKLVIDVKNIHDQLSQPVKFSEAKRIVRDAIAELPRNNTPYSVIMLQVYITILDDIRKTQMSGVLLESALVDYNVVAPYNQVLKTPDIAMKPIPNGSLEYVIDTLTTLSDENYEKEYDILHSLLVQNIQSIVYNTNEYIFDNNNYSYQYNIDGKDDMALSYYINTLLNARSPEINYPLVYYFLSYINYQFGDKESYRRILDYLKNIYDATKTFPFNRIENVDELVAQYESLSLPELDNSILSLESVMNMEYEKDKEMEKIYELSDTTEKKENDYNIDILLSYLYTNRRYKHNEYTNSLFTTKFKSVGGYSYYNDNILVCEINDKYIASPVMDLGDDYKLKLICLTTDNQVIIQPF